MELKVLCDCGQKFKFEVEPVNGLMPFGVNCPICGKDGTASANALIPQFLVQPPPMGIPATTNRPPAPPPPPHPVMAIQPPAVASTLQINRPAPPPPSMVSSEPPKFVPAAAVMGVAMGQPKKNSGEFSMGLGMVGALLGAGIGAGIMYGLSMWMGFRFPLLGTAIGFMTGYGAKLMAKGTETSLGVVAGLLALVAVAGTLFLIYGDFPLMCIISVAVSVSFAYRIASG